MKKAVACLLEAYTIAPLQPDLLINLGTCHELMGNRIKAKQLFREAIATDYRDARPKLNLAIVEFKDGNRQESAAILKTIYTERLNKDPELRSQYRSLANSLREWLQ